MIMEKVNPQHPDKVADRIAGAIVDLAYSLSPRPKIAVEVLIGHGICTVITETSVKFAREDIKKIVDRIAKGNGDEVTLLYNENPQDLELAYNQSAEEIRAGDNGIFKGVPVDTTIDELSDIANMIYKKYPTDGKYILETNRGENKKDRLIVCQSNASKKDLESWLSAGGNLDLTINPLGDWKGGTGVDTGATNRKLGSDMGEAVTGGGLHGKDLSKADVSVNIYAHLKAQQTGEVVNICCAIGDKTVNGRPYNEIVEIAKDYIQTLGGFEKLAEWGLV